MPDPRAGFHVLWARPQTPLCCPQVWPLTGGEARCEVELLLELLPDPELG